MISLFLSIALAACPEKFGIQQTNGSWSFYNTQVKGSIPVEVDAETCEPNYRALVRSGDKFVVDKSLVAAANAEIEKEKSEKKSRQDLIRSLKSKDLTQDDIKRAVQLLIQQMPE